MNNEQHNSSDKRKLKERLKTITIIVLIIIIIILLLRGCNSEINSGTQYDGGNNEMQIIEDKDTSLQDTTNGTIRIKMNPIVTVKGGSMEDLNFCNYNENRLLKIEIIVGDECLYESGYIKEGEILKGDLIDMNTIEKGERDAIAQVYSFTYEEELISQTTVAFKLNSVS